ncbi:hypothetical protein AAHA92_06184 [Salvia divinorum]|uniref:Protein-S-isoprenylcysteine O-methyltransferase n=1 Tax=Salvia divinorum TaxID=28513 RepID=A0ABD1I8W3_SALDI
MESAASVLCYKVTPFSSTFSQNAHLISLRPFNKLVPRKIFSLKTSPRCSLPFPPNSSNLSTCKSTWNSKIRSLKCSYSTSPPPLDSDWLKPLKNLSFESLKSSLAQLTPIDICKWCFVLSAAITASKWALNLLLSPFFWMYFSWTWVFWPWAAAVAIGAYGLYSLGRHLKGEATLVEQLSIVTSTLTWLTLVPPAHFNGFLEGWPLVFFFIYHYFFFLNVSVRKRLYGDYYARDHDAKWDIALPSWQRLLFCGGVMAAHWGAAFEGVELHLIPGGWSNVAIWGLIGLTVFMQYHSTLYLAKYSEKVVVPTVVVQFGPYRVVRHPIYASTMLLFVTYFAALRAPVSAVLVVAVCLLYYGRKAEVEEAVMVEAFGERYTEYVSKVPYKLIPFLY